MPNAKSNDINLFYVYELNATGCESSNGADDVWYPDLGDAFNAASDALDTICEFDGKWEWSGSIKRIAVSWEEICEAWEGEPPSQDKFEKVNHETK